ncbi:MAG: rod shape-determining protein RodA [Chlorobi bacterium]|nr:rod shape-determining protein RodA [Chlorobiota bacterium]
MERRKSNLLAYTDWTTIVLYLILVGLGWINVYSSAFQGSHPGFLDFSQRYGKQFVWIIAALILAFVVFLLDTRFYYYFSWPIYLLSILSLILVLILGKEIHGSKSWFVLGSLRLQPGEFAKVATALVLAKYMARYSKSIGQIRVIINTLIIILLPALLILMQPDTGSTLVYTAFFVLLYRAGLPGWVFLLALVFAILFILTLMVNQMIIMAGLVIITLIVHFFTGEQKKYTLTGSFLFILTGSVFVVLSYFLHRNWTVNTIAFLTIIVSGVAFAPFLYRYKLRKSAIIYSLLLGTVTLTFSVDYVFNNILEEHQQKRINILLGLESDPYGSGYNVNQSKIAIGSGGFTGKGFLKGTQTKFNFVPEQSTDFIFCTVGEEWGFVGTTLIITLYVLFLLRILYLAERQKSIFSRIYGYAVFSLLAFHFTVNIGMTIGLMPVIGIPLPFFSYGGSSLWAFTILLFIFLRLDASRLETIF